MADAVENGGIARKTSPKEIKLSDDYLRYEQIGNVIYMMATPARIHEAIVAVVLGQLLDYLDDKPCRAYGSNIGLDLKAFIPLFKNMPSVQDNFKKKPGRGKGGESYLLPDVSVLCDSDERHYGPHGYQGTPRLLIEVSSPATNERDFYEKRDIYEAIGVGEYWIISDAQNVTVFVLKDSKYVRSKYETEEQVLLIPVSVFPDLVIKLDKNKLTP
jgi:Uma2 family endonuclease